MKKIFTIIACFGMILTTACTNKVSQETKVIEHESFQVDKEDVLMGINLTVSESKRLIAKGIANLPQVKNKLKNGKIIITRGTTNTYIAEELIGLKDERGSFLTGHFTPVGVPNVTEKLDKKIAEITLVNGEVKDIPYEEALKSLNEGDIIFKGGNLLNYNKKQAAVCIGAPDGGTTYRFLPYVGKGKAQLIVPIGLEKETSMNLEVIDSDLKKGNEKLSFLPKIHIYEDYTLYTEIEAIKQFANVKVFPYGIGGIAGREGGISLVIAGSKMEIEKVTSLIKSIQGEKPFIN